jgi:hypothetical protein
MFNKGHCISEWGADFRLLYSQLGNIRWYLPDHVSVHVVSATMPPHILADVTSTLRICSHNVARVTRSNNHLNISIIVEEMKFLCNTMHDLTQVLDMRLGDVNPLPKFMIFTNSRISRRWPWSGGCGAQAIAQQPPYTALCVVFLLPRKKLMYVSSHYRITAHKCELHSLSASLGWQHERYICCPILHWRIPLPTGCFAAGTAGHSSVKVRGSFWGCTVDSGVVLYSFCTPHLMFCTMLCMILLYWLFRNIII